MSEEKITEEKKLYEEKKVADPFIVGFYESMAKMNTKKITKEIMEGLSEDSNDSDSYDVEMKILRIGPGGQAIPSSGNRALNKVVLTP